MKEEKIKIDVAGCPTGVKIYNFGNVFQINFKNKKRVRNFSFENGRGVKIEIKKIKIDIAGCPTALASKFTISEISFK